MRQREFDLPVLLKCFLQATQIPLLLDRIFRHIHADQISKTAFTQGFDLSTHACSIQNIVALLIDDFSLIVGYIIVFEQLFADIEVARFNLALRAFDTARDNARFNRLTVRHFQPLHDGFNTITRKNTHQRIIKT